LVSILLIPFNVFYFSVGQFNSLFSISFERWKILALLVFRALGLCFGKNQMCLFARWLSQRVAQRMALRHGAVFSCKRFTEDKNSFFT